MGDEVLLVHQGAISTLTLNRPQAFNAINSALAKAFSEAIDEVAQREQTRVLVIQGNGKAFMAGGDVPQFNQAPETVVPELIEPMNHAILTLRQLSIPVLASVQGAIAGAGISLMLACDLAIGSDTAKVNFAYTKLGASCDLGISWTLPRVVGLRKALEIALLAEPLSAQQALDLGLFNQLVPADELEKVTQSMALRLAQSAPIALAELKALMQQSFNNDLAAQLEAEKQSFAKCLKSADFKDAVVGFLEKRPVVFKGI